MLFSCSVMSDSLHPMDCNKYSLSFTISQVSDAIQPSCPLLSPSPPGFNLSQHQGLFNESVLLIRWPKYWSFTINISTSNEYSGLISFRMDWLDPTPQFKSINSLTLSFLYSPTHSSICNYKKTI